MPIKRDDIPGSLQRSAEKVRRAYEGTLEGAEDRAQATKTKDELLADAREAGIEGRSKMNKDELADALEQHFRRDAARARG